MNLRAVPAVVVAIVVTWLLAASTSWKPAAAAPSVEAKAGAHGTTVGLLNLTKVFKEHHKFKDKSDAMKKEVDAAEETLKSRRTGYEILQSKLKGLRPGTEEHQKLEADLARMASDLQVEVNLQKQQFLRQESQIYLETYEEIMAAVKVYCEEHDVDLILRFNNDPVNRSDPQEILKELNKSVLYYSKIDITSEILAMVNGDIDTK